MSKYYSVHGETRKKVKQLLKDRDEAAARCRELRDSYGADAYVCLHGLTIVLAGFRFAGKKKPDEKKFRLYYNQRTKSTRIGTVLGSQPRKGRKYTVN